jgi:DNA polymerase/3'-5' exonuclease PolX
LNKRVVEQLANRAYAMELDGKPSSAIWAYRKAAWAIEDLEQELGLFYRTLGVKGLEKVPGIGPEIAQVIETAITSAFKA